MKNLPIVPSSLAITSLLAIAVGVSSAACGIVQVRTPGSASAAPTAASQTRASATDAQAREGKAQEAKAHEAEAKEAAAQHQQELQAKASTSIPLTLRELGVSIQVPGDVQYVPFENKKYGDPALNLTGEASGFRVIVTDASSDSYGLEERIRQQHVDFNYGVDIIRQIARKDGGWGIEYSDVVYATDGTRMGTEYGYFGRRIVGGKPFNCFHAGQSSPAETAKVIAACDSLKPASGN